MGLSIVILAAGQGTRMNSDFPKVLHRFAGKPLIVHVYETAELLQPEQVIIVTGHGGQRVRQCLSDRSITWITQEEQRGTGHAVQQVFPVLPDNNTVLILYADVPLIRTQTLAKAIASVDSNTLALVTVKLDDPTGYGRIIRDTTGQVVRIVEEQDVDLAEKKNTEVNTGILSAKAFWLKELLPLIDQSNAQGEYYLTDIFQLAHRRGLSISSVSPRFSWEVQGINTRNQLVQLERIQQSNSAEELMANGVTIRDPARFDVRGKLRCGIDVEIDVNCLFEGDVNLGDRVSVGANCVIRNSSIASDVRIRENTLIENSAVASGAVLGPFAHLRSGTELSENVRVGNFVELKNCKVSQASQINHLSFLGDSELGKAVNIGAGTITCNFDGISKHRTVLGDNVFVGSDCQFVAPVQIGAGATIAAGSTITEDVEPADLAIGRARQISLKGWTRPGKKK